MIKTVYKNIEPYVTKDGSLIRELMHPNQTQGLRQSLAEATLTPGLKTHFHKHLNSEELYHVTKGTGILTLGSETIEISTGDTVQIPPGTPHQVENTGKNTLTILCCCAPPYNHEDTILEVT